MNHSVKAVLLATSVMFFVGCGKKSSQQDNADTSAPSVGEKTKQLGLDGTWYKASNELQDSKKSDCSNVLRLRDGKFAFLIACSIIEDLGALKKGLRYYSVSQLGT